MPFNNAAERAAFMYSLIVIAKMNEIDPRHGWPTFLPDCPI